MMPEGCICPCCGDADSQQLYRKIEYPHILRGLPDSYSIRRCSKCRSCFTDPMPSANELDALYATEFVYPAEFTQVERDGLERYLNLVQKCSPAKTLTLLDAGCASGFLLSAANARGWRVSGFDPSKKLLQQACQRVPDAELYLGMIEDAPFKENVFDVVTAINILEHLTDPLSFMHAVNRLLKPGGIFMFKTVSIDSVLARKKAGFWDHFKWPGHLIWYSRNALSILLQKSGYTLRKRYITGIPYIPGVKRYMDHQLVDTTGKDDIKMKVRSDASFIKKSIKTILKSRVLRDVVSNLINWLQLGDTVLYIVEKKQSE